MPDYFNFIDAFLKNIHNSVSFTLLLEAALKEGMLSKEEWERGGKWEVDENNKNIGSRDMTITSFDFVPTALYGDSISKSQYIFLPSPFVIGKEDSEYILKHIMALLKTDGKATVSVWPGYGSTSDDWSGSYPAKMYSPLPAEIKTEISDQLGSGGIIYAVNGNSISRLLEMPISMDVFVGDELNPINTWIIKIAREVPSWLQEIAAEIDKAVREKKVNALVSRMVGFEYDMILSTPQGDSVLVISKDPARAGYILRKKMMYRATDEDEPVLTDYDVATSKMMKKFKATYKRRPRGVKGEEMPAPKIEDKEQPKLSFRYWLMETGNGYALRRDKRKEDIIRLLNGGVNYADGLHIAAK